LAGVQGFSLTLLEDQDVACVNSLDGILLDPFVPNFVGELSYLFETIFLTGILNCQHQLVDLIKQCITDDMHMLIQLRHREDLVINCLIELCLLVDREAVSSLAETSAPSGMVESSSCGNITLKSSSSLS